MSKDVQATPDKQVFLIDPNARSMAATSGKGTGDVAHEASDRAQLVSMG
ncbi:hypothetical protein [Mesorhizobium sp. M0678]